MAYPLIRLSLQIRMGGLCEYRVSSLALAKSLTILSPIKLLFDTLINCNFMSLNTLGNLLD